MPLKVNINVSEMRQGAPGARVTTGDGVQHLFDTVEFTAPPKLVTRDGSCWLETDSPITGVRRPGCHNRNKIPFDQIDWSKERNDPSHQVNMRVYPDRIVTNDSEQQPIVDEHGLAPGYAFFWGHGHLHIEWVGDGTEIVETVEP